MPTSSLQPAPSHIPASPNPVRLCFISYTSLTRLARTVLHEFAGRAEIEVFDETFGSALEVACARERLGVVDAFVSAGGNAAILRGGVKSPVASIAIGGFDLLLALIKASKHSRRIGVVTYGRTVPDLDAVKSVLKLDVEQRFYRSYDEAVGATRELAALGYNVMVGSSVVVESAERLGLEGILAYSPSGIRRGIEDAMELARVARLESARHALLTAVLGSLHEAVLAVDEAGRLLAANPPMEALLGQRVAALVGRPLAEIAPDLGPAALNPQQTEKQVLQFANREWIAQRSPIRDGDNVTGATLTLYDAQSIQEADISLRTQRKSRGVPLAKHTFAKLAGASPAIKQTIATAERYARSHLTVLLSGESGTGKEMFAQAIHNASPRADHPFIPVNCAAFPESLLESELFGYEEGAFTGARRGGKRGLFEAAHTGTVLLDEIGDMPLQLQSRLLRVLQEREVVRLGGLAPIPVDVRVIAATHQPLGELVRQRRFREDLFYRINILQITLPPLRQRPEDILPLAHRFVARCLARHECRLDAQRLLAPLLAPLKAYAWRGNVRELENISERLGMFFSQFSRVEDVDYALLTVDCPELYAPDAPGRSKESTAQQIRDALQACNGNRQEAARYLGMSRATLWRRLQAASHETPTNDS
jgi:transcriptional regulator, propionate catabolism operon regulatory protein